MSLVEIKNEIGSSLDEMVVGRIPLAKIRKAVEEYPELIIKREKLQNRLIRVSGRDVEQEMAVMQRLESVELLIEVINDAVYGDKILTMRESCIVEHRLDGETLTKIGEFVSLSRQRVNQILYAAYKKISDAAKKLE